MTTAQEVINIAQSQIGYTEYPPDSNNTKYGEWYGMNYEPWCDMFVSWVFAQADASNLIGGRFAYCPYHERWFRENGLWVDSGAQPGDVVFFGSGIASHIGIVKEAIPGGAITIEGNTSTSSDDNGGAVMERTRYEGGYIRGYGRPQYDGGQPQPEKREKVQYVYNGGGDVYRLYNPNSGMHHYTLGEGERAALIEAGWNDEGIAWKAPKSAEIPVYRMYNPNNGDHFYTQDFGTCESLQEQGWKPEGVPFFTNRGGAPVFRLYNPNSGEHFYTASEGESDNLRNAGWDYEGVAFNCA